MMAALIRRPLWVNLATCARRAGLDHPFVVGGVMGAGIAAAGFDAVNWPTMASIAASWVISPVLGGLIGRCLPRLHQDRHHLPGRQDRRRAPLGAGADRGHGRCLLHLSGDEGGEETRQSRRMSAALLIGAGRGGARPGSLTRPVIARQSRGMENRNQSLRKLFGLPLIFSAALLSFAHGANDVANAVGPLAAIVHTAEAGEVAPRW
jgi:PiT family inorganic phosphate transporter